MKAKALRLDAAAVVIALAAFAFFTLALLFCVATVVGETGNAVSTTVTTSVTATVEQPGTSAPLAGEADGAKGEDDTVEAITMSIGLDEGAAIDVDLPESNVVIDTWRGEDVIVIVEKTSTPKKLARDLVSPMNIQVTRTGRDLRIAALDGDYPGNELFDVNFTILVPERYAAMRTNANVKDSYSLGKLTSVLWRAVGKEFLKWVAF